MRQESVQRVSDSPLRQTEERRPADVIDAASPAGPDTDSDHRLAALIERAQRYPVDSQWIERILREGMRSLGGESSAYFFVDWDDRVIRGGFLVIRHIAQPQLDADFGVPLDDIPNSSEFWSSTNTLVFEIGVNEESIAGLTRTFMARHEHRWLVNRVVRSDGKPVGLFAVLGDAEAPSESSLREFTNFIAAMEETAARSSSLVVEAPRLGDGPKRDDFAELNNLMNRHLERLSTSMSAEKFAENSLRDILRMLLAPSGALFRISDDEVALTRSIVVAAGALQHVQDYRLEDVPAYGRIAGSGMPILLRLPDDEPVIHKETVEFMRKLGHTWLVNFVVHSAGRPRWLAAALGKDERELTTAKLELFRFSAVQLAIAVEVQELTRKAHEVVAREREAATEARLAELARTNSALRASASALTQGPDLQQFVCQTLALLEQSSNAFCGMLFEHRDAPGTLQLRYATRQGAVVDIATDDEFSIWRNEVPADQTSAWAGILAARDSSVVIRLDGTDSRAWTFASSWNAKHKLTSVLCVPLQTGERPLGCVALPMQGGDPGSALKVELVRALADQLTLALELGRLTDAAQQATRMHERNRLARDLHDTLAQGFTSIFMQLEAAKQSLKTADLAGASARVQAASRQASQSLVEARRSVRALAPSAMDGKRLSQAIQSAFEPMTSAAGVQFELKVLGTEEQLAGEVAEALFRTVQESVVNAIRHGRPKNIHIVLSTEPSQGVELVVRDDGAGFSPSDNHPGYGLMLMRERISALGGHVLVETAPGEGTRVVAKVPASFSKVGAA